MVCLSVRRTNRPKKKKTIPKENDNIIVVIIIIYIAKDSCLNKSDSLVLTSINPSVYIVLPLAFVSH